MSRNQDDASSGPLSGVRERLTRTAELLRGSAIPDEHHRPSDHGRLVDDMEFDDRVVDRYWLNPPFAYAAVTYDDQTDEHLYRVVEPELDRFETELLEALYDDVRTPLVYSTDETEEDPEIGRAHV